MNYFQMVVNDYQKQKQEEQDKMSDFMKYRGIYMGPELKGQGTKKTDGTPWQKYKIKFQHDESQQYPVQFTWWEPNKQDIKVNDMVMGQKYTVTYVMEEYTNKDGLDVKGKKAVIVKPSQSELVGFEQETPSNPVNPVPQPSPQQNIPQATTQKQNPKISPEDYLDMYREKIPKEQQNLDSYRIRYLFNVHPELQGEITALKQVYENKTPPPEQQPDIVVEDV